MMSHNYRIYGSIFLLLEVIIVAMGVRFVQLLAPVRFFKNKLQFSELFRTFLLKILGKWKI